MTVGKSKRNGEEVHLERTMERVDGLYVVLVLPA